MKQKFIRGVLSVIGGKVGILLFSVIYVPLLVRGLGSGGYGEYIFVLTVFDILMIFSNAGLSSGVRKFISEDREYPEWKHHVFGFYLRIAVLIAVGLVAILFVLEETFLIDVIGDTPLTEFLTLLGLLILSRQLLIIALNAMMGINFEHYSESLRVSSQLIYGIGALVLIHLGYGVRGALLGNILGAVVVSILGFAFLSRHVDLRYVFTRSPENFPRKELLNFNIVFVVLMFLSNSLYHTDVLLLQPLVGSNQTGFYKAALMIAEFIWFVPAAFQTMLLHSTTSLWTNQNSEAVSEIASRTSRYVLMLTLLLLVGLVVLADSFMPIYYGESFSAATTPLLILLPGTLFYAIVKPIIAISEAKGVLRYTLIATGGAAAINLVLNVTLIPEYGMVGAAVATSIGYSMMFVFNSWAAYKLEFNPFIDLRLRPILTSAVVVAAVLFALDTLIQSDLLALGVLPPLGLVCYIALLLRLGALDYNEIDDIVSNAPDPINRMSAYLPS